MDSKPGETITTRQHDHIQHSCCITGERKTFYDNCKLKEFMATVEGILHAGEKRSMGLQELSHTRTAINQIENRKTPNTINSIK